jgi:hypothetical protein
VTRLARMDDPGRVIAILALKPIEFTDVGMLQHVILVAFEQLCHRCNTNEMDALLRGLAARLDEEHPS